MVPLPVPLAPAVIVTQLTLLEAVREQPELVVILTLPLPPVETKEALAGEIE
jgi:hypothetical protein